MLSHVLLFVTLWAVPTRLLCPCSFSFKNPGVGYHFLFHEIFLMQGLNPHLLHWQAVSLPLSQEGIFKKQLVIIYSTLNIRHMYDVATEIHTKRNTPHVTSSSVQITGLHGKHQWTTPKVLYLSRLEGLAGPLRASQHPQGWWPTRSDTLIQRDRRGAG